MSRVRYYVIYNSKRKRKARLEVHRLEGDSYVSLAGTPAPADSGLERHYFWLPEIGLGLGKGQGTHMGWQREWLYWCDPSGKRFLTLEERAEKAEKMAAKLRELGVDPENF
ncbi:hypothetical protein [Gloeobacter kilaueensis]|uniref:Uncharacterized protein n=1 Tax=Gloeobacter kilaueensis (strain ATCC BAA-2537 / CCAP 1431/1 / ULC 316 / JS1) TaxID=1183438 RepID=U5QF07_GLOK1|nr:hypothetical protein [Gloeobacter kilaueensis]AGY57542.1 hypothetical protein GKIL_1296 [Gloeobacter kilaueensis JS1]